MQPTVYSIGLSMLCASATFLLTGCTYVERAIDAQLNSVASVNDQSTKTFDRVSSLEHDIHQKLLVMDMHADSLLWNRNLETENERGHVDFPRLRSGNVAVQTFSVVTNTPIELLGRDCITSGLNSSALLAAVQGQPLQDWFSEEGRASSQASRLRAYAANPSSDIFVRMILSVKDLTAVLHARRLNPATAPLGAVLSVEGAHWLGDDELSDDEVESKLDKIEREGFRIVALTHRFDNKLSGSSEGCGKGGLSDRGKKVLIGLQRRNIVVDLAHISSSALHQATSLSKKPMIVSHAGVRGTLDSDRNLSDADIRDVARTDGVVGIGYWPEAVGSKGSSHIDAAVDAMVHTLKVLQEPAFVEEMKQPTSRFGTERPYDPFEHIALGSDFDGAVHQPIDASKLSLLTTAMLRRRKADGSPVFPLEKLKLIAGSNFCRVLVEVLAAKERPPSQVVCRSMPDAAVRN